MTDSAPKGKRKRRRRKKSKNAEENANADDNDNNDNTPDPDTVMQDDDSSQKQKKKRGRKRKSKKSGGADNEAQEEQQPHSSSAKSGKSGKATKASSSAKKSPVKALPAKSPKRTAAGPKTATKKAAAVADKVQDAVAAKKKKLRKAKPTKAQLRVRRRKKLIKARLARLQRITAWKKKSVSKYQIRCRRPVEDEIFDVDEFVKYIKEHFKVDGKTGEVGHGRQVNVQKSVSTVHVMSKIPFPKYYLKFLTKRYLKKHGLRDYVRVIADKKISYELRYFNIQETGKASAD